MKRGEKARELATHAVFIALVILGIAVIIDTSVNLTGYAVLDSATAKAKLESALSSSAVFSQLQQASLCVVINDLEQPLSLKATKASTGWQVSETTGYCSGLSAEDIVVQFKNYDDFSRIVDDPSPRNIANGAINRDFEVLQSRYVELGGNVICDAAFKVKYCGSLNSMASNEQLIDGDLTCCIDKLTSADKKLLEQHLQEGNYKDEIGILEQPGGGLAGLATMTNLIALGGIVFVILIIIVAVVAKGKNKKVPAAKTTPAGGEVAAIPSQPSASSMPQQPYYQPETQEITELRNYVAGALGQGYAPDEVRAHLLEIGWDTNTADRIIGEASQMAQAQ
jgi:hypothetical protein